MNLLISNSWTIWMLLIFSCWKVNWALILLWINYQCFWHSRWVLGGQLHLLMMSSVIRRPIGHSLDILSKLGALFPINDLLFRLLKTIITLLSRSTFIQDSSPRSAFHVLKNLLLMTLYRIWVNTNASLRSLIIDPLWVTLLQLWFISPRLSSLLLNSNDVIRIHGSVHSQYWLMRHMPGKVLATHILHLELIFMMRFRTWVFVLGKHDRNKHIVHSRFVISLATTV